MDFKEFKQKYEHKKVEEQPNQVPAQPVVSVCVVTYQHKPYIKQCLDGILMQKTDIPFEILLGEDASTDGTREICLEYAAKYPDKIRLFLHHRENNIKIGGNPSGRFNFLYNSFVARGKYIALCEGDDYWIDPLKLQKQVDFLEENKDCSIVFTDFKISRDKGSTTIEKYNGLNKMTAEEFFLSDIKNGYKGVYYYARTLTLLFRKEVITDTPYRDWMNASFAGDFIIKYRALILGKFGYVSSVTSVYNASTEGSFSNVKKTKKDVKKQYRDYLRALYYLNYLSPISEKILNEKIISIKKRMYFLLAFCVKSKLKGFFYLCYNFNKTSVFYILLFIKRNLRS